MVKICLVAHDAAPSGAFQALQIALTSSIPGVQVVKFVGYGAPIKVDGNEFRKEIESSNFVLIGMSSTPEFAEAEILAGNIARSVKVPYGFYSDATFAIERARKGAWFHDLSAQATLVIGLFSQSTVKQKFSNAYTVQTGNPLREEMSFPLYSREMVRKKLGIGEYKHLIHVPGGKFSGGNIAMLMFLLDALSLTLLDATPVVVFTPHPGDPMLRAIDKATGKVLNPYQEIASDAPVEMRIVNKDFMASSQVVIGADLVVEYTGSISVEAAYLRIPVISPTFEVWIRKFAEEAHTREVELVMSGSALRMYPNVYDYGKAIRNLLKVSHPDRIKLIEAQERAYPRAIERGATIREMVHAIRDVL